MLLTKTYFFTSSPAQPCERPEYKLTFTSQKYHYVFDLYKQNNKTNHRITGHSKTMLGFDPDIAFCLKRESNICKCTN